MKKTFYFPLTVNVVEKDDWGIDWNSSNEQDGRLATEYRNEIEIALDDYTDGEDMAEYISESYSFKAKVTSMIWGLEDRNGCLYGKVDVELTESLTESEIEKIKDYITGQNSDGLGEGFEQREIKIPDGVMYVSFWKWDDDYYIYTEEEFEAFITNTTWQKGKTK